MNNHTPIFDDRYNGPRWTYGLRYRPIDAASIPQDYILWSDRAHPHYSQFGTIDYPRELSPDE